MDLNFDVRESLDVHVKRIWAVEEIKLAIRIRHVESARVEPIFQFMFELSLVHGSKKQVYFGHLFQ